MGQLLKQTEFAKHKGVSEAYVSNWIKRHEVPLVKGKLDLEVVETRGIYVITPLRPWNHWYQCIKNLFCTRKHVPESGSSRTSAGEKII